MTSSLFAAATLAMEKLAIHFHVSVDVKAVVLKSIKNELRDVAVYLGRIRRGGAVVAWTTITTGRALKWEDTSIKMRNASRNLETKSRILMPWAAKMTPRKRTRLPLRKPPPLALRLRRGIQRQGNASAPSSFIPKFEEGREPLG